MTSGQNPLAGRRFTDENGRPVTQDAYIGEGGEGWIYGVKGSPDSVMKIWKPGKAPTDAQEKIRYMVQNQVVPPPGVQWTVTWPEYPIMENGHIAGFTMPKLDNQNPWTPVFNYYNQTQAQSTSSNQARAIQIGNRVRIASNLALGYAAIHKAGYVIGDINQQNAEANRQDDVALMDCDSYGFTDRRSGKQFPTRVGMPEFQAPEAQNNYASRTQEQDLFALAVLIFQLLTGFHPYTVTNQPQHPMPQDRIKAWLFPPANKSIKTTAEYDAAWNTLTSEQQDLFRRCFDKGYINKPRPTPDQWAKALKTHPAQIYQQPIIPSRQQTPPGRYPNQGPKQPPNQPRNAPPRPQPQPLRPTPPRPQPQPTTSKPETGKQTVIAVTAAIALVVIAGLMYKYATSPDETRPSTFWEESTSTMSTPLPTPTFVPDITVEETTNAIPTLTPIPVLIGGVEIAAGAYEAHCQPSGDVTVLTPKERLVTSNGTITVEPGDEVTIWKCELTRKIPEPPQPTPWIPTDLPAPTPEPMQIIGGEGIAAGEYEVKCQSDGYVSVQDTPQTAIDLIAGTVPIGQGDKVTVSNCQLTKLETTSRSHRNPTTRLQRHPGTAEIKNAPAGSAVTMDGCYLGPTRPKRKFYLASRETWDPSLYGNEIKFAGIVTNSGKAIPLEHGTCYELVVHKLVNDPEGYVCLDADSTDPMKYPCDNPLDSENIPIFILYPNSPETPQDFSQNVTIISP